MCSPGANGVIPSSPTGPSAHLLSGSASRDSWLPLPTAEIPAPEWGRSALTYSLTLTYSVTLRLKAQPHRPGHCFHPRTVLSQQTPTWRHPYRLQKSQMPKHGMVDTNVTGLEMQAQSCEPTCTDHPTQTPGDATTQPSRLSRNLPSRWAGKWQPLRGKAHRPRGQPASDICGETSWSLPLQDPLLPQPLLTCVPSALLPPGTPRLQPKSLLSQTLPSPSSFPQVHAYPPTSLPALCSHRLGVPHLPPPFCPWLSHPNVLPLILPPACLILRPSSSSPSLPSSSFSLCVLHAGPDPHPSLGAAAAAAALAPCPHRFGPLSPGLFPRQL